MIEKKEILMKESCDRCHFVVYHAGYQVGVVCREWDGVSRNLIRYKCPQCSLVWTDTWLS
jgi:hypothetical protein